MDRPKRIDTQNLRRPSGAAGEAPKTVLIADDDVAFARGLERVLAGAGYGVTVVHDGAAAMDAVIHESFGVILCDVHMPGLRGVDLLAIVRAYDLDVPVVLVTASPTVESAAEAVNLGALQYLVRPLDNDVVVYAVERGLQLHALALARREAVRVLGSGKYEKGEPPNPMASFDRGLAGLWMAFQPIVDSAKRRVFGYEALVRSTEPGMSEPPALLAAAERLDRLPDLGRRVRKLSALAFADAPSGVLLFVNLHTRDLLDAELFSEKAPLSKIADRVVLEITERATIDDIKDIEARVSVLRYLGFRIAIDDLGAGYAGLASFAALEPDIVKLDMSLVRNVHESAIRKRLVTSMTTLCKDMGIRVVAEGIERREERVSILESGCDLLQGYLFAKPGPPFPIASMLC